MLLLLVLLSGCSHPASIRGPRPLLPVAGRCRASLKALAQGFPDGLAKGALSRINSSGGEGGGGVL